MLFARSQAEMAEPGRVEFTTTHWSVVLAARDEDAPGGLEALNELCKAYWFPLYAFVRHQGVQAHEAQDLTQEFLATLLRKRDLARVGPEKGRFRSFLLVAMKHFLINEWEKARARPSRPLFQIEQRTIIRDIGLIRT